jgi:ubiquinone/menaquinone biosynthesis C-methylase UbiE
MYNLKFHPDRERPVRHSEWSAKHILDYLDTCYHGPIKKTLDLGMGRGELVQQLKKRGIDACGVDLRDLGQKDLIQADARNLPFEKESFDLVTEVYFLADMNELQRMPGNELWKVVQEAKRILKPGGIFLSTPARSYREEGPFEKIIYENEFLKVFQK